MYSPGPVRASVCQVASWINGLWHHGLGWLLPTVSSPLIFRWLSNLIDMLQLYLGDRTLGPAAAS